MNAIDTNVWVYFHDKRDTLKQATARQIVNTTRALVLPWQVGCEFIAASRKLEKLGFTNEMAWEALAAMQRAAAAVALPEPADWLLARDVQQREVLSFWDALLLATCIRHGVTTLYTEDMGSPRAVRGVQLVHPFSPPAP